MEIAFNYVSGAVEKLKNILFLILRSINKMIFEHKLKIQNERKSLQMFGMKKKKNVNKSSCWSSVRVGAQHSAHSHNFMVAIIVAKPARDH